MILGLSARTVDDHIAAACRRLGVRTRVQAVLAAVEAGLLIGADIATAAGATKSADGV
jgi:ATP/maltotriose-dependent transcriptional regulator MalT